ncbi:MAG: MYXO-CTERM domain-containing protein [Candidatus Sulfopaludibacter sp.]|nr:MYXO-CTERM domain-containing protein [Candidatus Sulfopaludibacter sp.]
MSSSGNLIRINNNGTATPATGSIGWGFGSTGSNAWLLCAVCGDGVKAASQPAQGIVPNQVSYSSSVGSVKGNPGHNPFLESGATFTFEAAKLLPIDGSNPFSEITLSFSTAFGVDVNTVLDNRGNVPGPSTPEPVTTMLAGAGLIVLGLVGRRRRAAHTLLR